MHVGSLTPEESLKQLDGLECLVQESLRRIVSDPGLIGTFDSGAAREKFLDRLALQ
jgi:hypothetical protein